MLNPHVRMVIISVASKRQFIIIVVCVYTPFSTVIRCSVSRLSRWVLM